MPEPPANAECYPTFYADWLLTGLGLQPGDEIAPPFIAALQQLHDGWVRGEGDPAYAMNRDLARAYAGYYLSLNLPKLWFLLDHSGGVLPELLAGKARLRACELGCGPGTFLWALLFYLARREPRALRQVAVVRGVDQSPVMLEFARALGARLRGYPEFRHLTFEFERGDWRPSLGTESDLLIFGNVLNESPPATAPDWAALRTQAVAIIEPGTSACFHRLLPCRDALLAAGWHLRFPCPTPHPCPMAGTDNWCHFHVNRFGCPLVQRISAHAARHEARHHFCGFLFARQPSAPGEHWRILSNLRKTNRSGIRYLCDGEHLVEAVVSRRDRSPLNRDFFTAPTGVLATLDLPAGRGELLRTGRLRAADRVSG